MKTTVTMTTEEKMKKRNESTVLCLQKKIGRSLFRYLVGERRENEKDHSYSVYAEYSTEGIHTYGHVTAFTDDKEKAMVFCRMLLNAKATPLSLEDIYEDMLTP